MKLPKAVVTCMQTFTSNSFAIYVVGGPVRDMLLKRHITNWDFATNALPEDILRMFPHATYENSFGTVLIPFKDETDVVLCEVTPFRREGAYTDARHPDSVEWADTIEEDLKRRDFTINAMAYDGINIIDLHGGRHDLKAGIIKAVGDPALRFQEDALRLLRAVRFASELGFTIEQRTLNAMNAHADQLKHISWERIRDEWLKILGSPHPADGVLLLRSTGLLSHIVPELEICFGVDQKSPERHHQDDVGTHLIASLRHCPSIDPITRFAALIHDIGKPDTRAIDAKGVTTFYNHEVVGASIAHTIATRLRLSKKDKERLSKLVRYHMFSVSEELTDKTLRRFIAKLGLDTIHDLLDIRTGDRVGSGVPETSWRTELFKKRLEDVQVVPFSVHDLAISGTDIMQQCKIAAGPKLGAVMKQLYERVVDGDVPNEEKALAQAALEICNTNEK